METPRKLARRPPETPAETPRRPQLNHFVKFLRGLCNPTDAHLMQDGLADSASCWSHAQDWASRNPCETYRYNANSEQPSRA